MSVLSVDLAYKSYKDIGTVVLDLINSKEVLCNKLSLKLSGRPNPNELAQELADLAYRYNCNIIMIDGPQAWKHPNNEHEYQRDCERKLNTPAKTGLPGSVLPKNYRPFVCFSIDVFNYLCQLGFPRLENINHGSLRLAVESFPLSAWKALGLKNLKAKAKCKENDISAAAFSLTDSFPLRLPNVLTHDELQATVSGLGGLAIDRLNNGFELVGQPPVSLDGIWREGFIVNPRQWDFWEIAY
jgi:hypothetical protein